LFVIPEGNLLLLFAFLNELNEYIADIIPGTITTQKTSPESLFPLAMSKIDARKQITITAIVPLAAEFTDNANRGRMK